MKNFNKLVLLCAMLSITMIGWSQIPQPKSKKQHNDRCVRQKSKKDKTKIGPPPAKTISLTSTSRTKAAQKMSLSDWNAYSGSSLVQKLKESVEYDNQLRSLYDYEESYSINIFSDSNIESVARAMYNISISHDGTYRSGMYGLVCYLHAAVYHEFFQAPISLGPDSKYWYKLACESFSQNSHLFDMTAEAISILDEYLIMVDDPQLRHNSKIINVIKKVMRNMVVYKNWKQITDSNLLRAYSTMVNRIYFVMFRGVQEAEQVFIDALKNDTEFYRLVYQIATDNEIMNNDEFSFLCDNSVGELSRAPMIPEFVNLVDDHLAGIAEVYPRLSGNWLVAIEALNLYCDCSKFGLCKNLDALRTEIEQKLFPNTWTFGDGKIKIRTGLSYEHVEPLYYASQQVEAQVFRILQTDEPVANDPNRTLNIVLYSTLSDYSDYQLFLNDIPSDNGGMYIERGATFYTYERTLAESTYSLEELFRHEYTHYLQGRYIENGMWSETDFYLDDRLTWFDEGMAEFMAGSTSSDGIKYRQSMMNYILGDGADRMTVSDVIGASYDGGSNFYRYGHIIWLYWYHNDMATMREIINYVRTDNITAFDAKMTELKNSSSFQRKIDDFTDQVLANPDAWWTPTTPYLPDAELNVGRLTDIETEFRNITGISNIQVISDADESIRRFGVEGKLSGSNFNQQLDQMIKKLNADEYINNFDYLIGYYKNVSSYSTDFYISGSLRDQAVSDTPVCNFTMGSSVGFIGQEIELKSTSTGYIKGFRWESENARFTNASARETKITFNKVGKYNIRLTVTGNNGATYNHLIEDAIEILAEPNFNYCEATTSSDYAHIRYVGVGDISNINYVFNPNGYGDFTKMVTKLTPGASSFLSIDASYPVKSTNMRAWIDWDQNGSFEASEQIMDAKGLNPLENDFQVPSNAKPGLTCLRIRYSYDEVIDACQPNGYIGETHDYSIIIEGDATTTPPDPSNYCESKSTSFTYEWIKTVSMASFSNSSEGSYYSDYTNTIGSVTPGQQTWVTVQPGFYAGQSYTENVGIWVDWNKNEIFDPEELIFEGSGTGSIGNWFMVPATFSGSTRMRVALQQGSRPNSCGSFQYGEVEDYTLSTTGTKASNLAFDESLIPVKQDALNAYPNPTNGMISLEIPEQYNDATILIVNMLGVTVFSENVNSSLQRINLSQLTSGNYIIIIRNDEGSLKKQIVIN